MGGFMHRVKEHSCIIEWYQGIWTWKTGEQYLRLLTSTKTLLLHGWFRPFAFSLHPRMMKDHNENCELSCHLQEVVDHLHMMKPFFAFVVCLLPMADGQCIDRPWFTNTSSDRGPLHCDHLHGNSQTAPRVHYFNSSSQNCFHKSLRPISQTIPTWKSLRDCHRRQGNVLLE